MKSFNRQLSTFALTSLSAAALILAGACASKPSDQQKTPAQDGLSEYRQIAMQADQAIRRALDCLTAVSAQSNRCSPEVLTKLSGEIDRLQVESMQVRARSQAMQARGDAYFERWHENMAQVKDPQVRVRAEEKRPELQQAFRQIKALSQEGREAFNPFLSDLRQLRNALEKDPASIDATATRDRIREAMESGNHTEQCIAGVSRELNAMSAMLMPQQKTNSN